MEIISGSELSLEIKEELKKQIASFEGRKPCLAVILVGDNPASLSYVKSKNKAAHEVGFDYKQIDLDEKMSEDELIAEIHKLNLDDNVDGILVQLPLPDHMDKKRVLKHIDPHKDVDGLTPYNVGKFTLGEDALIPCTPLGVMELLRKMNVEFEGKNAVVVGRSNLVGLPVARLLLNENCTVTTCHSKTKNLSEITNKADILVVAINQPRYIKKEYVKEGAYVIDVGINRVDGKLCGDVDFDDVKDKCQAITPVPKGVGPMTVTMLLKNTVEAYLKRRQHDREL